MPTYVTPGVYVEELPSGSMPLSAVPTAVAAFVGFTQKAPLDDSDDPWGLQPRLVTNLSQFNRLYGGHLDGAALPHAVRGYFENGGGSCYIVRVPHRQMAVADVAGQDGEVALQFVNISSAAVKVAITAVPDEQPTSYDVEVTGGDTVESFSSLQMIDGPDGLPRALTLQSQLIDAVARVPISAVPDLPTSVDLAAPKPLDNMNAESFKGSAEGRHGIDGLVIADDVTIVAVPDLYTLAIDSAGVLDDVIRAGVHDTLVRHCKEDGYRMALIDPPPGLDPQGVKGWLSDAGIDSTHAALYYPWVRIANPTPGQVPTLTVPPCGHIAGVWARVDDNRGVHKAPANEAVRGIVSLETSMTAEEQGFLNPDGINAIRSFSGSGPKVWGARTLSRTDSSWRYLNVRRLFNMIEKTIGDQTQWVVFEPNDQALWERVNRTVTAFLTGVWRQGALFGATAGDAFYVKCDEETNPPESRDEGRLVVEIGLAPVKPAEFVIFRFSQKTQPASS